MICYYQSNWVKFYNSGHIQLTKKEKKSANQLHEGTEGDEII